MKRPLLVKSEREGTITKGTAASIAAIPEADPSKKWFNLRYDLLASGRDYSQLTAPEEAMVEAEALQQTKSGAHAKAIMEMAYGIQAKPHIEIIDQERNEKQSQVARPSSELSISPTGVKLWDKYYPGEEWHSWFGFSTELPDGSLVNAGGLMEFDSSSSNYWVRGTLTKTDYQGSLLWQRKYYTTKLDNYFFSMIPTADAGFLMYGFAYREGNYRQDAWAVKVDSLGCLEPGCAGSVAAPEPGAVIRLDIRPNPTADWLTVASPEAVLLGLRLTDLTGRVVEDVQFFRQYALQEYRFSLAALPPGTYVLSVRTDKGWVSEQVVKQ